MISNAPTAPASGFVLVLLDGTEKDIIGIWGPYAQEAEAQWALKELNLWPIDGIWDLMPLKYFPVPQQRAVSYRTANNTTVAPQVVNHWPIHNGVWT